MTLSEISRRALAGRGFGRWLLWLLALGALQQGLLLADHWAHNPFARAPLDDAKVYWSWAGDIAAGRLVGDTPFLSAPLYPYVLGLLRACGGGLLAAYLLQGLLRLASAALLALCGRKLVSPAVGLGSAALFLALADPAEASCRILNESLQVFLVAWLLWECLRAPWPRAPWALGLCLGLNALANPTMLAAIPVLALWLGWNGGRKDGARAAALAVLVVAPATAHNLAASGEFILVSAQGGVTFAHGNAAGADGTYHPIPGVAPDRVQQNRDAYRLAAAATGTPGWRSTSSYFLRRGLQYWSSEPGAAAALALRKARWFCSGVHYGDVYLPVLERGDGFLRSLWLAPLPVAWILPPALLLALLQWRRARALLPLQWLLLLPLGVVLAFFYSPRYRLPAVAPAVLLAAWSAHQVLAERRWPQLAAWGLGVAGPFLNAATGFDGVAALRPQYLQKLATAFMELQRNPEAEACLRAALAARPDDPDFSAGLGEALRRQGRADEALPLLRAARDAHPDSLPLRRTLAVTLAESSVIHPELAAEAEQEFQNVLQQTPDDWMSLDNLAVLLDRNGRTDEAVFLLLDAQRWAPRGAAVQPHLDEMLSRLLPWYREHAAAEPRAAAAGAWLIAHLPAASPAQLDEALAWARGAQRAEPGDADFLDTLAAVQARRGQFAEAVAAAQQALERAQAQGNSSLAQDIQRRLSRYQAGRDDLMDG